MDGNSNLLMDIRPGEFVEIGAVRVGILHKSGQMVRLCINAPEEMVIEKKEINRHTLPNVVARMAN